MKHLFGTWLAVGLFVVVLFGGCRQEPTRWNADVALPLVDATWGWDEVLGDTLGELTSGTPGVLRFSGKVAEVALEELTVLPDTLVENVLSPAFAGGPFEVPPGAVLLDEQQDIVFQGIEQEFTRMSLEAGKIEYFVRSKTNGYVHLRYDFPSVTIGGAPVVLDVVLPPSPDGGDQIEEGEIDLASAIIDFTGASGTEVNRINSNLLIGTPADIPYTALVYGNDSINVEMLFTGLTVRDVEGYFGQIDIDLNESTSLFDPERFPSGVVSAMPVQADLKLHNTMGADLAFWIESLELAGAAIDHPAMGMEQVLARADWSTDPPATDTWELDLLDCSPNVFEALGALPSDAAVGGKLQLNPLGDVSAGNDYLRASDPPYVTLDLELPLSVGVSGLVMREVVTVDARSMPGFVGELVVRLTHDFPVEWTANARFVSNATGPGPEFTVTMPVGSEAIEVRLPVDAEHLAQGGTVPLELHLDTDGAVPFSGEETVQLQLALEGQIQAVIE